MLKIFLIFFIAGFNLFAGTAMVKSDGITVHKEPDFKSLVIFRLKKNTAVEVSETSYYGWHTTSIEGKKGYIHASSLILNYEGAKTTLERSNPFDIDKKPRIDYFFDAGLTPVGIAGQQFYTGFNFTLGYEGSYIERAITFTYGTGMGEYKVRVASFMVNIGWKFTRYTSIGAIAGYEFLQFSDLLVQKSPKEGRVYKSSLDPRGPMGGGFLNQKIEGDKFSFVMTQGALVEMYSINKYSGSEIIFSNPVKETKDKVKPRIYIFASFAVRFYL